jgi:hypothetical protein
MTDEIKARPRPHRRTRPARPARPARPEPELVEDDFGSTAPQPEEEMVTTIVSRGTVYMPHPTETFVSSRREDGSAVKTPRLVRYRPGCELKLPVSEAKRLIEAGTLVLPGELPLVGPHPDLLVRPDRPEDPDYAPERGVRVHNISDDGRTILGER